LKLSGEKDLVKEETGMCCFDGRRTKGNNLQFLL
jgi:hypothetical protein